MENHEHACVPQDAEDKAFQALRLIPGRRREMNEIEYRLIAAVRSEGVTWKVIASALCLDSPQAAQQRYRRLGSALGIGATESR